MKSFSMFAMVVAVSGTVLAQVPATTTNDEKSVSGEATFSVQSKYLDHRSGHVYTDGPVAQDEVIVSILGLDFGVWHSASLDRTSGKTDGDELDYTLSKSVEGKKGKAEFGVSYYDFAKICHGRQDNAYAGYAELSRKDYSVESCGRTIPIEDYVRFESVVSTPGSSFEGGFFATVGSRTSIEINNAKIINDCSFTRNDGVYGLEPDIVFAYNLSAKVDKWGWTFSPNFTLTAPFHGEGQTEFGLSASREF